MPKKRCDDCGRFMKLTDRLPMEDEFDYELARECGYTDEQIDELSRFDPPLCQFVYVQDLWECDNCHSSQWHTEGPKYYYDHEANNYLAAKPITPKEQAELDRQAQEAAGQLRLPIEAA